MQLPTTIRSQADLHVAWRTLMGPLGFSGHMLWLMLIDEDGRPTPQLAQIEDDGRLPSAEEWEGFAEMLRMLCGEVVPRGRVAALRSRPGAGGLTQRDRAWARGIYEAGRVAVVDVEVVHRACDVDLVPVPMDEALADSA